MSSGGSVDGGGGGGGFVKSVRSGKKLELMSPMPTKKP